MQSPAVVVSSALAVLLVLVLPDLSEASIRCYECDSSNDFTCTEFWNPNLPTTEPYLSNCSHVFEAAYCIKMTGILNGKLGTKRFCSSRNWGNYCEYIKRPGDIQEYRSCVFSCGLNGCNGAERAAAGGAAAAAVLAAAVLRTLLA